MKECLKIKFEDKPDYPRLKQILYDLFKFEHRKPQEESKSAPLEKPEKLRFWEANLDHLSEIDRLNDSLVKA
jgi:hypothetical protein